jgi:hypothetical protein
MFVTLLPPRRLPKPWLSLALTGQLPTWESRPMNLSRSVPSLSTIKSGEARDEFPVCDDLTDAEDDDVFAPSTPVRSKGASITWQQPIYDDGPRTAPLTNPRSGFLFDCQTSVNSHPGAQARACPFPKRRRFQPLHG